MAARRSRQARQIADAPRDAFRRLTPKENIQAGRSTKARNYVLKSVKRIAKSTTTISARQYETKRTLEKYGLTPERAAEARRQGAISYVSADQRERVAKAARTRVDKRVAAGSAKGARIPNNSPNPRRHGRAITLRPSDRERYRELRRRKIAGETIPDGDWHWLMDVASFYDDPDLAILRGSPGAFAVTAAA